MDYKKENTDVFHGHKRRSISSWVTKAGSLAGVLWNVGFIYYYLHRAFSEYIIDGFYQHNVYGLDGVGVPLSNPGQTIPISEWW